MMRLLNNKEKCRSLQCVSWHSYSADAIIPIKANECYKSLSISDGELPIHRIKGFYILTDEKKNPPKPYCSQENSSSYIV